MTNEQLAELIGKGGNDELLPLLWEKTRKLFRMWSDKYYAAHRERCVSCGVTAEDIKQESYLAMSEAAAAYAKRTEENAELLFTSFCKFPFKNHAAALIGMRTQQQKHEPLNNFCTSLDEVLTDKNGDETSALVDTIPDEAASQAFENVDEQIYNSHVREVVSAELDKLPEREKETIRRRFYEQKTLRQCAEEMGISSARVRQIEYHALRSLRKSKPLKEFAEVNLYMHCSVSTCQRYGSAVELAAEKRDRIRTKIQNDLDYRMYLDFLQTDERLAADFAQMIGISPQTKHTSRRQSAEDKASNFPDENKAAL